MSLVPDFLRLEGQLRKTGRGKSLGGLELSGGE